MAMQRTPGRPIEVLQSCRMNYFALRHAFWGAFGGRVILILIGMLRMRQWISCRADSVPEKGTDGDRFAFPP